MKRKWYLRSAISADYVDAIIQVAVAGIAFETFVAVASKRVSNVGASSVLSARVTFAHVQVNLAAISRISRRAKAFVRCNLREVLVFLSMFYA